MMKIGSWDLWNNSLGIFSLEKFGWFDSREAILMEIMTEKIIWSVLIKLANGTITVLMIKLKFKENRWKGRIFFGLWKNESQYWVLIVFWVRERMRKQSSENSATCSYGCEVSWRSRQPDMLEKGNHRIIWKKLLFKNILNILFKTQHKPIWIMNVDWKLKIFDRLSGSPAKKNTSQLFLWAFNSSKRIQKSIRKSHRGLHAGVRLLLPVASMLAHGNSFELHAGTL